MRSHSIVGIYELQDKIACIHFVFGIIAPEEYAKDKCTPSYALLDVFSADFSDHKHAYLAYNEQRKYFPHLMRYFISKMKVST